MLLAIAYKNANGTPDQFSQLIKFSVQATLAALMCMPQKHFASQLQSLPNHSRNAAAKAAGSVITLRGDQLEVVSQFKYLGSVLTSDCTLDSE